MKRNWCGQKGFFGFNSVKEEMGEATVDSKPKAAKAEEAKPLLRGVSHQYGSFCALIFGSLLVSQSPDRISAVGSSVYVVSLVLLLTASACYHRISWSPNARKWMRRLDHSSIFLLIAGTYTPICLLALQEESSYNLLRLVWTGALAGIIKTIFWPGAPKALSTVLYVMLGWTSVLYASELSTGLGPIGVRLMASGGLSYTIGAVFYAVRWPNPIPNVFGYHEVFHALVILASVLHFYAVMRLVHKLP